MQIKSPIFLEMSIRWMVAPVIVVFYYITFLFIIPANLLTIALVGAFLFGKMQPKEFLEYALAPFFVAKTYLKTGQINLD